MELRRPVRVSHDYTQFLVAPRPAVFPLLCPVRERDWVPSWQPGYVISESGFVERDCVFTTSSDDGEATWYVTEHDSREFTVEMLKIVPGFLATRLRIELEEADGKDRIEISTDGLDGPEGPAPTKESKRSAEPGPAESLNSSEASDASTRRKVLCRARIQYSHTALSTTGEAEVRRWDDTRWREFMEGWQTALNAFLVRRSGG